MFHAIIVLAFLTLQAQPNQSYEEALAKAKETGQKLSEALDLDPGKACDTCDSRLTIRKLDWEILNARVAMLTFQQYGLTYNESAFPGRPGFRTLNPNEPGGFFYWTFSTNGMSDDELVVAAGYIIRSLQATMPSVHVSAHCIVFEQKRENKEELRFYNYDREKSGKIVGPVVSITPPRASVDARKALAQKYKELAELRKILFDEDSPAAEKADFTAWMANKKKYGELMDELLGDETSRLIPPYPESAVDAVEKLNK